MHRPTSTTIAQNSRRIKLGFSTILPGAFVVVMLVGLLGYAYLDGQLINYRRAVLPLSPNVRMNGATFRLLHSRLFDRIGGPSCVQGEPEVLLIQTTATRFSQLIAYSRRLASPNDHNLVAVFVHDTLPGQPWLALARQPIPRVNKLPVFPANWLATLTISQPSNNSTISNSCRMWLLDIQTYRTHSLARDWFASVNYDTDSVREYLHHTNLAHQALAQLLSKTSRQLSRADGCYYSPYRARVKHEAAQ